jgi:predicted PolB exonuclease-like 3'-5' exonuclease
MKTDVSGKWIAVSDYKTMQQQETEAILNMANFIKALEQQLVNANARITELEQQIYGSK